MLENSLCISGIFQDLLSQINRGCVEVPRQSLSKVAGVRASFGAIQSRLEHASSNLDLQNENVQAARSRIVDAMTMGQIQQELGIAVLAQANQNPNRALKLFA